LFRETIAEKLVQGDGRAITEDGYLEMGKKGNIWIPRYGRRLS
jgi:hypothetical protein